ncbi:MAG: GSCFA domain-containing protein [Rubrivivax sp.]|nr:GSCFA domain-containing protein [Rubrivivax sp.]
MSSHHPYRDLPDHRHWQRGVATPALQDPGHVDPVVRPAFRIAPQARIATAGSCFAQHVARHLALHGVPPFVTERAHPLVPDDLASAWGYGDFGARYGNVYTARQLLQLMLRAFGELLPADETWRNAAGRWVDPFRPRAHGDGTATLQELRADRAQHFAAVRRLFAELDVFVFTLGLTEAWASADDGAVYPVCPGVVAGTFDPARHVLQNHGVDEVVADLDLFLRLLRSINPRADVVLTVSPVPLVATALDRHVVVSTAYSKAVLRVAAEEIAAAHERVAYFPSLEIISSPFSRGAYFAPDLRSVTEAGVSHVMRLFLHHYLGLEGAARMTPGAPSARDTAAEAYLREADAVVQVMCDEEALGHA